MRDPLFSAIYKRALRFLGIRLRSVKEMQEKIREWLYRDEMPAERKLLLEEQVIEQLIRDRFLDDKRFAEEWVHSRMRSKPRGEMVLRMELSQKGVDRDLIDDVLYAVKKDSESGSSMRDGALRLAEKFARKFAGEEDKMFVLKLSQALLRKGFDSSLVKGVVDELLSKRYNS